MTHFIENKRQRTDNNENKRYRQEDDIGEVTDQNYPRFLVIQSLEEDKPLSKVSPFVIEKCLHAIAGEPKSVKKIKAGLLVEVNRKSHSDNLLKTTSFFNIKVKVSPHNSLNTSKGVFRCRELADLDEAEILSNLKKQGVTYIRRFKFRKDGELKNTNTFQATFNSPILPTKLKVAFMIVNVEPFIPNPLRCYACQKFGHHEDNCKANKPVCVRCSEQAAHPSDFCEKQNVPARCANCGEEHWANSRKCPKWITEKEILRVKVTQNLSFQDARNIVEKPVTETTYSQVVQGNQAQPKESRTICTQTPQSFLQIGKNIPMPKPTPPPKPANNPQHQSRRIDRAELKEKCNQLTKTTDPAGLSNPFSPLSDQMDFSVNPFAPKVSHRKESRSRSSRSRSPVMPP